MIKTVLVVDDSRFMRNILTKELSKRGYNVLTARNGRRAVEIVRSDEPDVITMDVKMPKMDGLESTGRIMASNPTPIIMLSAHTNREADTTLDALDLGAVDFLMKPDGKEISFKNDEMVDRLVRVIETVTQLSVVEMVSDVEVDVDYDEMEDSNIVRAEKVGVEKKTSYVDPSMVELPYEEDPNKDSVSFIVETPDDGTVTVDENINSTPTIIIGASTGGPKVIENILRKLPLDLNARVILIQHMPVNFTERLAKRLNKVTDYTVTEAYDGAMVGAGEILLAKGGYHLEIVGDENGKIHCRLNDDEKEHNLRPAIDVTMISASEHIKSLLFGVVLTGMGSDGSQGIKSIKQAGGYTIAQNKETSTVFGIPKQSISTGCVDAVIPNTKIVSEIVNVASENTGDKHD